LAEVAGAVAVVVTLALVAVEMRANTSALQAQTYQNLTQELNDYRILLLELGDRGRSEARAKWRQNGWDSLTSDEQRLFRLPSQVLWGIYESAYFARERGVLGDREWTRFNEGICRNRANQEEFWAPDLLTSDFLAYVEALCG